MQTEEEIYIEAVPELAPEDVLGIEKPPSFISKFVEGMLYFSTIVTFFPKLTPLAGIPRALGAVVMIVGCLSFFVFLIDDRKIPISIWFAVIINIGANYSQVIGHNQTPIFGEGLTAYFHWISYLVMLCYLVQNKAAEKRVLFFFGILVLLTVYYGGVEYSHIGRTASGRLALESKEVGSVFANANDLAYMGGILAIKYLFDSLRSAKFLRPLLWTLALLMVWILIRTVSRGGIFTFGCGLMVLVTSILLSRGVRLGGIILIVIALIAVSQFGYLVASNMRLLGKRSLQQSVRTEVLDRRTLYDLWHTKLLGKGAGAAASSSGVTAHNSFLYTHMSFGGITAWPYLLWQLILGIRVFRMMRYKEVLLDVKLMVVAVFGMALGSHLLSNQGHLLLSGVLATAIVEKYTSCYSKRRIKERMAIWQDYDSCEDSDSQ